MAIAFDTNSGLFDNAGSTNVFTLSHTCTGSNLVLVVPLYVFRATVVSGVTYNGVAMTQVSSVTGTTGNFDSYIFILIAPATGAHNIVATTSANITGNHQIGFGGLSYTGCSQTGQPDSSHSTLTTGITTSPFTVSTTVVASNCWLVGGAEGSNGEIGGGTAGSGTTYRGTVIGNIFLADSNGTVGTGSQSLNWGRNPTGSGDDTGSVLSLVPAAAVTNNGMFALM